MTAAPKIEQRDAGKVPCIAETRRQGKIIKAQVWASCSSDVSCLPLSLLKFSAEQHINSTTNFASPLNWDMTQTSKALLLSMKHFMECPKPGPCPVMRFRDAKNKMFLGMQASCKYRKTLLERRI